MSTPLLQVESLTVRLGGHEILHDVSLSVPEGARHVIVGPNGVGKTTLLNVITGSVRPSAGFVRLCGRDITRLPPHRRARLGITRTWQHPTVCERLTVADNLALATRYRPTRSSADPTLGCLLDDLGLRNRLATRVADLPYGHRRLVEFAVALAAIPRLLLLDEPTAGLDTNEVGRVVAVLRNLGSRATVVVVEHDRSFIDQVADTITKLGRDPSEAISCMGVHRVLDEGQAD